MKTLLVWVLIGSICSAETPKDILPFGENRKPNEETPIDPAPVPPQSDQVYIASFDTYGSKRINAESIKKFLGKDYTKWIDLGVKGDPKALKVEKVLVDRILGKYGFAYAAFSIQQYFQPGDLALRITLDVVEKEDMKKRAPFYKQPKLELNDPGGAINAWKEYMETGFELAASGGFTKSFRPICKKSIHCVFGHNHKRLSKFEKTFHQAANKNTKRIVKIQSSDARAERRGAATYILAYMDNQKEAVKLISNRLKDPHPMVRANALRVLMDVAEHHPKLKIQSDAIYDMLNYAALTDRAGAAYLLLLMQEKLPKEKQKKMRTEIIKRAGRRLLEMLGSQQPNNYEVAHALLLEVSGKDFGPMDRKAWENWYKRLPAMMRDKAY